MKQAAWKRIPFSKIIAATLARSCPEGKRMKALNKSVADATLNHEDTKEVLNRFTGQ
jgi:hypothetical protein